MIAFDILMVAGLLTILLGGRWAGDRIFAYLDRRKER